MPVFLQDWSKMQSKMVDGGSEDGNGARSRLPRTRDRRTVLGTTKAGRCEMYRLEID